MAANLLGNLITLLERIDLQGYNFSDNQNLQKFLILTTIWANTTKFSIYINELDNFHAKKILLFAFLKIITYIKKFTTFI